MHLKIVLHIKIQFVSIDVMVLNESHFNLKGALLARVPCATLWSFVPLQG